MNEKLIWIGVGVGFHATFISGVAASPRLTAIGMMVMLTAAALLDGTAYNRSDSDTNG